MKQTILRTILLLLIFLSTFYSNAETGNPVNQRPFLQVRVKHFTDKLEKITNDFLEFQKALKIKGITNQFCEGQFMTAYGYLNVQYSYMNTYICEQSPTYSEYIYCWSVLSAWYYGQSSLLMDTYYNCMANCGGCA